mmetsp:Transcript_15725/g.32056  ORF Transcript_15725/g.32056 Transcript_15725/m.32056 type:complete len:237 (-) Transcript_15725:209-919(-)
MHSNAQRQHESTKWCSLTSFFFPEWKTAITASPATRSTSPPYSSTTWMIPPMTASSTSLTLSPPLPAASASLLSRYKVVAKVAALAVSSSPLFSPIDFDLALVSISSPPKPLENSSHIFVNPLTSTIMVAPSNSSHCTLASPSVCMWRMCSRTSVEENFAIVCRSPGVSPADEGSNFLGEEDLFRISSVRSVKAFERRDSLLYGFTLTLPASFGGDPGGSGGLRGELPEESKMSVE